MARSDRMKQAVWIAVAVGHSSWTFAEHAPTLGATFAAAEESVLFGMVEARFAMSDRWLISVGAAYLDPGSDDDEAQLRLSAIGTLIVGGWTVENRHLFSFSSASVERYRMRMRAVRPRLFGNDYLSARAFDEVFFDLDTRRLFRNNVAAGVGMQLSRTVSGELYHVWEMNRSHRDRAYVLALLTFRFGAPHTE